MQTESGGGAAAAGQAAAPEPLPLAKEATAALGKFEEAKVRVKAAAETAAAGRGSVSPSTGSGSYSGSGSGSDSEAGAQPLNLEETLVQITAVEEQLNQIQLYLNNAKDTNIIPSNVTDAIRVIEPAKGLLRDMNEYVDGKRTQSSDKIMLQQILKEDSRLTRIKALNTNISEMIEDSASLYTKIKQIMKPQELARVREAANNTPAAGPPPGAKAGLPPARFLANKSAAQTTPLTIKAFIGKLMASDGYKRLVKFKSEYDGVDAGELKESYKHSKLVVNIDNIKKDIQTLYNRGIDTNNVTVTGPDASKAYEQMKSISEHVGPRANSLKDTTQLIKTLREQVDALSEPAPKFDRQDSLGGKDQDTSQSTSYQAILKHK